MQKGFFDKLADFYQRRYILSNCILMFIVAVFIGFLAFFFLDVWTDHGHTSIVPEIRNKSYDEARNLLEEYDLVFEIADSVYDTSLEPGTVKEVWPHPGSRVKPGRMVYLTINSFQPQQLTVTMPLTGVSSRQAITYLESLNIKNIRIVYVPSNFPDLVEGASFKGKAIQPGMKIPVNANVVLEVGTVTKASAAEDEFYEDSSDSFENIEQSSVTEESSEEEIWKEIQANTSSESPSVDPDVFD